MKIENASDSNATKKSLQTEPTEIESNELKNDSEQDDDSKNDTKNDSINKDHKDLEKDDAKSCIKDDAKPDQQTNGQENENPINSTKNKIIKHAEWEDYHDKLLRVLKKEVNFN